MDKVIVIGGGASGLIAALKASESSEVIIVEGNDKCGKKILITGNGKCNYWNSDITPNHFNITESGLLKDILSRKEEVLDFLYSLTIYPKIKNGYYYPMSGQAFSIREILFNEVKKRNITVLFNFKVTDITKDKEKFVIHSENDRLLADKVILACGGSSYSKTGSDGTGYLLAAKLGHKLNKPLPGLVPLITDTAYNWDGVRIDAGLTLYISGKMSGYELGELQLTKNGLSGICSLNLSGRVSRALDNGKRAQIRINFMPPIDDNLYTWFNKRNLELAGHTLQELLESIINYKVLDVIFRVSQIKPDERWENLSEEKRNILISYIGDFPINIIDTESFDRAQTTVGGIPLEDINVKTMESKIIDNLYIVGELLDVDGKCGGYNLAFAWISGYIAGLGVTK